MVEELPDFDNYTIEEFQEYILNKFFTPNTVDWIGVPIFVTLFLVGLAGNFLVVFVVARNATLRTFTNILLLNLALADFLVLVFCLPLTVLWDMTRTWAFGTPVCKAMLYFQNLSVTVSVLTLVCISVERWYAICNPLKFMNSFEKTRTALLFVWIFGMVLCIPEAITLEARNYSWSKMKTNFTSELGTTCGDTWGTEVQKIYQLVQTVILFIIPLSIISVMYGQIAFVLWLKSVPPTAEHESAVLRQQTQKTVQPQTKKTDAGLLAVPDPDGINARRRSIEIIISTQNPLQREVMNRRKAAKMLIAVVVLFAMCYLPVHVYNILRIYGISLGGSANFQSILTLTCRFLTYFNSCVNPILYNFMSEKFQREFRRACCCLPARFRNGRPFSTHEAATLLNRSGLRSPIHRIQERLMEEKREASLHL